MRVSFWVDTIEIYLEDTDEYIDIELPSPLLVDRIDEPTLDDVRRVIEWLDNGAIEDNMAVVEQKFVDLGVEDG